MMSGGGSGRSRAGEAEAEAEAPGERGGRAASPGRRRTRPHGVAWRRPWRRSVAVNSSFPVTIYSRIARLRGPAAGGRSAAPLPVRPEGPAPASPARHLFRCPRSPPPPQARRRRGGGEGGTKGLCGYLRLHPLEVAGAGSEPGHCDPGCPLPWSREAGGVSGRKALLSTWQLQSPVCRAPSRPRVPAPRTPARALLGGRSFQRPRSFPLPASLENHPMRAPRKPSFLGDGITPASFPRPLPPPRSDFRSPESKLTTLST